ARRRQRFGEQHNTSLPRPAYRGALPVVLPCRPCSTAPPGVARSDHGGETGKDSRRRVDAPICLHSEVQKHPYCIDFQGGQKPQYFCCGSAMYQIRLQTFPSAVFKLCLQLTQDCLEQRKVMDGMADMRPCLTFVSSPLPSSPSTQRHAQRVKKPSGRAPADVEPRRQGFSGGRQRR
ncbi:hypothetical protein EJB05_43673, partial [Eragrostis curvula]